MLEVAISGSDHGHVVGVAVSYALGVTDGTSGVYHCCDTGLACYLHTVGEGEEGVGSHDCTVEVVAKRACFLDSLLERVDT